MQKYLFGSVNGQLSTTINNEIKNIYGAKIHVQEDAMQAEMHSNALSKNRYSITDTQ